MDIVELFPEWDTEGDPYIDTLIKFDDAICDARYNFEFIDLTEADGERHACWFEAKRDEYEIWTLARWWALNAPQPVDPILVAGGWS